VSALPLDQLPRGSWSPVGGLASLLRGHVRDGAAGGQARGGTEGTWSWFGEEQADDGGLPEPVPEQQPAASDLLAGELPIERAARQAVDAALREGS
jgi:hypothetical protein